MPLVLRIAVRGRASRCARCEGRGEREAASDAHAPSLAQRQSSCFSPGMRRSHAAVLLGFAIALAVAPVAVHAQRTRADEVPLEDLIEIVVMEDEILGIDATGGGSSVVRRHLGEDVLWTGVRGRVGVVITDRRVLALAPQSGGWQEAPYERGERPASDARLGDRVAVVLMPKRVIGFLGTVGRFVQERLGPQEDLRSVVVGANVALIVTERVALGLSPEAGGFFPYRLQLKEKIRDVSARANVATIETDQRVLVFRAPTGTWAERRH